MAYKIKEDCTNCGACDDSCGPGAISEKDDKRWIDPDACVDCGACESACPIEAIVAE